ncbi:hypothetical protein D9M70_568190 [compost metagenome]
MGKLQQLIYLRGTVIAEIKDLYFTGMIDKTDLFGIGRPLRSVPVARTEGRQFCPVSAVLRTHEIELILTAVIRPVSNVFAIG